MYKSGIEFNQQKEIPMSQIAQEDRHYRLENFCKSIVEAAERLKSERNLTGFEILLHHKAESFLREIKNERKQCY